MKLIKFLLAFLTIGFPAMSFAGSYLVEVGQFEKLKVTGNLNVIVKNVADSIGYARYDASLGDNDIFSFSTKGDGALKIQPSDDNWGMEELPVIWVYTDYLSSIESYSEKRVEIYDMPPCTSFSAKLVGNGTIFVNHIKATNVSASITTGNGSIIISGQCINANFKMVGAGLISADRLVAENVKCRILGTGSIGCWPVDNLNVAGLGSTKIYYKGKPNIKKSGGGKLFELPDDTEKDVIRKFGAEVPSLNPSTDVDDFDDEEEEEVIYDDNYQTVVTEDD